MSGMQASLSVQMTAGPDDDQIEVDRLSMELRRELLELDVDTVTQAIGGPPPPNAKTNSTSLADVLTVSLSNSAVLVALVQMLGRWKKRGADRKIKVQIGKNSIEIGDAAPEAEARLIESWIEWHARH